MMNQQVNLYNPALAPTVEWFTGRSTLLALGGVLAAALAAWTVATAQTARLHAREAALAAQLTQAQGEVTRLAQQAARRKPDPAVERELADLEALLAARNQVLATLDSGALGDTGGVSEYFRAFARQTMDGVWLTGFSISGAGNQIVIQGRTVDAALVPGFLARLREEGALRGHGFESLTVHRPLGADGAEAQRGPGYLEFRLATYARDQQDLRDAVKPGAVR
jgi:hypothetical protein